MKNVTIKDIAKKAGVDASTVSRVLSKDKRISAPTYNKVKKIIEKSGYKPNSAARILAGGKTNNIAVVIPSFMANVAINALKGIETELINTDYGLQIFTASKHTIKVRRDTRHISEIFRKILNEKKADAVISITLNIYDNEVENGYEKSKIPLVFVEGKGGYGHRVAVDNVEGSFEATKYLIRKKRKRIGFVVGTCGLYEWCNERFAGYKKALGEGKIDFDRKLVYQIGSHYYPDESARIFKFMKKQHADAVFCAAGDRFASGLIKEADKQKIKIPQTMAVIGYDDFDIAEHIGLTTVRQPAVKMGKTAFNLVLKSLKNGYKRENIKFKPELIIRKTA